MKCSATPGFLLFPFKGLFFYLRSKAEQFKVLAGVVQGGFASQSDARECLLQGEDVAAHLLDAVFVHPPDVLDRRHENAGDQVADTLKNVLQINNINEVKLLQIEQL